MKHSYIMVAGDKQKHLDKIPILKSDVVMINLEDGVYDKEFARDLLLKNYKEKLLKISNKKVVVRVNELNGIGEIDIEVINKLKPDAIRVPKIKYVDDVKKALKLIDKDIYIHLSIETKESFNNIKNFNIDNRVTTLYLGILDLLESLGLPQSLLELSNPTIDYILSKFLIDSKSVGLKPVSFVYQDYKDIETFTKWCTKVKNMGYSAKACISPSQVDIINNIFKISKNDREKALYMKTIFEEKKKNGISGFSDEVYGFIDEPIYKDALLVLKKSS